ncbi:ArsR family transcriptional regulator [Streptomyces sp. 1114.5]|uniref:ArsR/SmtB family transcription factor n=1 Tax=unclassified Streptomyces TaxID=2593676 RepID=UPI000BC7FE55|nr:MULTISPECIES: metalloregulator ArsR/SmtB family transcription factor [unclassified Streptomyces]RKT17960.1 ArsR family transcriptional regulator [Streptomyces sp. 1114.5]SOB84166.1 transcriptional regulator, ArsR family [Streptomyces sp. 1331.2]
MRTPSHPATESIQLAGIFHALSDPARLSIVTGLAEVDEQCCSDLDVPLSKSTLSHHLKVLREAGVTTTRVEGTRRLMSLRRDDLELRFPGLLDAVLSAATREPAGAH